MKTKKYFFAALYLIIAALPVFFGLDIISVLFLSALLTFYFVILGHICFASLCFIVLAALFFTTEFSIIHTVVLAAFAIPVSFLLGYGLENKKSFSAIMMPACTAAVAVVSLAVVYCMKTYNLSAFQVLTGDSFKLFKGSLQQAGADANVLKYVDVIVYEAEQLLPSILIISVCIFVYAVFGVSRYILKKSGFVYESIPTFSYLRLSRGFTIVFLGLMLISFLFETSGVTLNIITVVTMMFCVCGLSYCNYYLKKKNVSKPLRALIYIAVFVISTATGIGTSVVSSALFVLGIVDSFRNLRGKDAA